VDDLTAWTRRGGAVEPNDRAAVAKPPPQALNPAEGARFELRDATTDLIHNAGSFDEMVVKADRLGAVRFTAIDAMGQRSSVDKAGGAWQPPPWVEPVVPTRGDGATAAPAAPSRLAGAVAARIDPEAERGALLARLEAALNERYVIKRAMVSIGRTPIGPLGQTEYRFRGDTSRVAFIESTFRLATDTNSPSVARSMVDVAQARNWRALRVSGHEEFRRMVWFEASLRGVTTIGYEPLPSDMSWLRSERETRQANCIEPTASVGSPAASGKASAHGRGSSGSRKTVLAAIEAVLVAQRVPQKRREAIMTAAADNLARRLAAGEVHRVKVYDKAAPQQQPVVRPVPEQQRARERTARAR
jgi:Large polyvalent protein-associated domain 7